MEILEKSFYERDPKIVAANLLGKKLIRRLNGESLEGVIVETEAYYGLEDPASRAYKGKSNYNSAMWEEPGRVFIYNVHNNWLLNVVAHEPGKIGAVLIRAIEPVLGIEAMKLNRMVSNILNLANGPGKLTKALKIDKSYYGIMVTSKHSEIFIADHQTKFEIGCSRRIGVSKDLDENLRFFIKGSRFLSR
ncbi:DNA-3-methyladenine glycosylase [Candidatus Bathyarchaeota archaeon]|nr:DNA-3-methyladenine glycosylase [Candidatus Bathyarchaeota archaeon]MBS7631362.1 DNA-3-methyladenine glycosylase [Candidatus Bathyarchaeota archaeon]